MILRRHFLLSTAACFMVAAAQRLATAMPSPRHDADWVERNLIDDAVHAVTKLWDFDPVKGQAFGFMPWTIGSAGELREKIYMQLYDVGDATMWERVELWAQMDRALIKKFGGVTATCREWLGCSVLPGYYVVADYLLGGTSDIRSVLSDLEHHLAIRAS